VDFRLIAIVPAGAPPAFFDAAWERSARAMFAAAPGKPLLLAPPEVARRLDPARLGLEPGALLACALPAAPHDLAPGLSGAATLLAERGEAGPDACCVVVSGLAPVWGKKLRDAARAAARGPVASVRPEEDYLAQVESGRALVEFQYLALRDPAAAEDIRATERGFLAGLGWTGALQASAPFHHPLANVYNAPLERRFVLDRLDDLALPLCVGEDIPACLPPGLECGGLLYALSDRECRWVAPGDPGPEALTMPCGLPLEQAAGFVRARDRQLLLRSDLAARADTLAVQPVFPDGAAEDRAVSLDCARLAPDPARPEHAATGWTLPEGACGLLAGLHRAGADHADFLVMQEAPDHEWDLDRANMKRFLPRGGAELSGRQVIPGFETPDGLLAAGRLEQLQRIDALLAQGRVGAWPRTLDHDQEQALRLFQLKAALAAGEHAHV